MARRKLSFTTRYVLAFGLLMLLANALLGVVGFVQSEATIKSLVNKNMLDVVETASALLDGDALAALTEADVEGPVFRDIEDKLIVFQNHEDVRYIYAVRGIGDGKYVFTVDPDPEAPGAFGEEIVVTDALIKAGNGVATVDTAPMADRWGNYYSAYCPVFDSAGQVAGIVGIDFDADWYNARIHHYTITIAVVTLLSVVICGVVVFLITMNVRRRFTRLDADLSKLSSSVDQLMEDTGGSHAAAPDDGASDDEIEKLSRKIQTMQRDMLTYERLKKDQYYNDAITGIPNLNFLRQFADERVNQLWAAGKTPVVIYFDIRSMLAYNTEYGYSRGDALLRLTGQSISAAFPGALVGRGEGDHFIVVDGYDDAIEQKAVEINEKIKREAFGHTTGIQCAVVKMRPEAKAVDGLQRAMSALKQIGDDLNVVCRVYAYEEDSEYLISRYVVQHFDEAMQQGWVRVYYQPILRTSTQKITILEALARWVDPERGVISPGQFIPVLSRYHLLHKLDQYMVEQICREYRDRAEAGLPGVPVSINFSAQDFDYIDVAETLNRTLEKYGVPRSAIIVEITEQALANATDAFREQLRAIQRSGYRLWLDDFGSGYSSLNVFSQYHVDRIKFDMDLVRHLDDNDGANRIIMRSIVDMCRQMGIHTLAEGIETQGQYQFLNEIDCEMVQGFYFFRPESVEAMRARIQSMGDSVTIETQEERNRLCARWAAEAGQDAPNRTGETDK